METFESKKVYKKYIQRMLFRKFKKALELNKGKVDFPGKKIYYDKITLWFAAVLNIGFMLLSIVTYSFDKELEFLLGIPIALLFLPGIVRKLIFKNPVYIFQNDRFYNTMEGFWFDKSNSKISYKFVLNSPSTIRITDLKENIEIEEVVMYLDDATIFRQEIKKYSDNKDLLTYIEEWYKK